MFVLIPVQDTSEFAGKKRKTQLWGPTTPIAGGFFVMENPIEMDLVGGWATPLKNMKVNGDDYIPNIWRKQNVPNHQPGMLEGFRGVHFLGNRQVNNS